MSTEAQLSNGNRRPLKSRSSARAQYLARALVRAEASPNVTSVFSIVFAAAGALLLLRSPASGALRAAALCVQLRLLCNLLDGMVAIEGGRKCATGVLYIETEAECHWLMRSGVRLFQSHYFGRPAFRSLPRLKLPKAR